MEPKLQLKNLTISFRTSNGKVQAVRGIDFDLQKGETLAIVGESGSGKSVTSKAILGILANNSIIENGEIIYDGKDLLQISEEEFHRIRGDKISMIFQDPMSSLNPIVKIGRQLTEAMVLKGKARQRESRKTFNTYLKDLKEAMIAAAAEAKRLSSDELTKKCAEFDKFEYKHLELEAAYNKAYEAAEEAAADLDGLIFEIEKNAAKDLQARVNRIAVLSSHAKHDYVVKAQAENLTRLIDSLKDNLAAVKKARDSAPLLQTLRAIEAILQEAVALDQPNFFVMGYYLTFANEPLPVMPVNELNAYLRKYLDEHFMLDFIADAKLGLIYSAKRSSEKKALAIEAVKAHRAVFEKKVLDKRECTAAIKEMAAAVQHSINPLNFDKDSIAYTFISVMNKLTAQYFSAISKNNAEEKRFAKQQKKHDRKTKNGRAPDWKVAPKSLTDQEAIHQSIIRQMDMLVDHFGEVIQQTPLVDYDEKTIAVIDYLKDSASGVVNRVTKSMAKEKAIKLMEEVGIPEPRKRYNQYPFEFSGGMRQRIVIAIALAANPDILICDEPTTALDVTIQAQILELINKLKKERRLSVIFITHDLGVVANMADRIAVMYAGKIVELGTADDIFYQSAHPYTWALLSSMPDLDTNEKLDAIPGTPPNMIYPPVGDAFAPRNKYAMKIDFERQPPMFKISDTHYAATWLLHPDAPKVNPPKIITDRIARMNQKGGIHNAE